LIDILMLAGRQLARRTMEIRGNSLAVGEDD
jgi:hypothetical protein